MNDLIYPFKKGYLVLLTSMAFLFPDVALGQDRTETIAATGQSAPDGNGTISGLFAAKLSDSGAVSFLADLTGTSGGTSDSRGMFGGNEAVLIQFARTGQSAPDGNGTLSNFFSAIPATNNSGAAAFTVIFTGTSGGAGDNSGIVRGNGGALTQIVREGQSAPDGNGIFSSLGNPTLNDSNSVAFVSTLIGTSGGDIDNTGIFFASGGALSQIVREGQTAPDGNGNFSSFNGAVLNNSGTVAFASALTGTSGGTNDNRGVFLGNGGGITQVARKGQAIPDGNGTFFSFGTPELNESGQSAFVANLAGTGETGIYRGSGGPLTQIVRSGQVAPDGNGAFSTMLSVALNESGTAAFGGVLTGTSGGNSDNTGIFRGSGGVITQIARGQMAPDGNGSFSSFGQPNVMDSGATAFTGTLTGTSGGNSDSAGIYLGDGIDLIQVARTGNLFNGSAMTNLNFYSTGGLNEYGQVAYKATLANGNQLIQRFTPDLHWRVNFGSSWDSSSRWTLGLNPADVHDVYIDPAASLTVTGPAADTAVRSLQIGGGTGLATLNLRNGAVLSATQGVLVTIKGTLTGDGVINGSLTNRSGGTIVAQNLTVAGGTLTNSGVIRGTGYIDAAIANQSAGQIRASGGDVLRLNGSSLSNSGRIEVIAGELEVQANVRNNASSGLITGRDATMRFNSGLTNNGSLGISFGTSDIFGDISNSASGTISVTGGANATFYDDLTQNGTMQIVAAGSVESNAVVLGAFSGSGGFVGGGNLFAMGDLRPGNSPASVLFDGSLFLGASTDTFIELGGLDRGEYDQMLVNGNLGLAGSLSVSLIDGHTLALNQSYLIADIGDSLSGQFIGLGEGALIGNYGGIDLFISYQAGNGNDIALFTPVPEPNIVMLGLISWLPAIIGRRRRAHCRRFAAV